MSRLATSLALAALAAGPLLAQSEQRTLKGSTVAIYNLVGRIQAVGGSGDAVVVEITRRGADAAQLRIETGPVRGRESLRVVYPSDRIVYPEMRRSRTHLNVREDGTFSDGDWREWSSRDRVQIRGSGEGLEAHADLVVRVPRGQTLELVLGAGRVEVSNVEGRVAVDVAAADVEVAGAKGSLSLDTGSGRVTVRDVSGDLSIDSGSGGLVVDRVKGSSLRLDSGSGGVQASDIEVGDFNADVGSGGLEVMRLAAPRVSVETGSGGVHLELLAAVERVDVETGSGGATIRAPASLSAEVEVETGSGGFHTDFAIVTRRFSRNSVQGRISDGRGRITIEAGSGTVRLLKS